MSGVPVLFFPNQIIQLMKELPPEVSVIVLGIPSGFYSLNSLSVYEEVEQIYGSLEAA